MVPISWCGASFSYGRQCTVNDVDRSLHLPALNGLPATLAKWAHVQKMTFWEPIRRVLPLAEGCVATDPDNKVDRCAHYQCLGAKQADIMH